MGGLCRGRIRQIDRLLHEIARSPQDLSKNAENIKAKDSDGPECQTDGEKLRNKDERQTGRQPDPEKQFLYDDDNCITETAKDQDHSR